MAIDTNKGKWSDNIDYEVGTVYPVTHEWYDFVFALLRLIGLRLILESLTLARRASWL